MLLNGDDVACSGASFKESKWLVGMNYIVILVDYPARCCGNCGLVGCMV
jgi:hypothetical protein